MEGERKEGKKDRGRTGGRAKEIASNQSDCGRARERASAGGAAASAAVAAGRGRRQSLLYSWDLKEELKRAEKGEGTGKATRKGLVTAEEEEDGTPFRRRQTGQIIGPILDFLIPIQQRR